ncbi:MAG: rod shape-determining protein RodA [Acidimicrobiales bacterium]|nr:rod shape-determining protein RodA [Acidimicrobiales bacterium]
MASTYRPTRPPRSGANGGSRGDGRRAGAGLHTVRRPLANFGFNPSSPFRHVDLLLAVLTVGVALFGALMVYSATRGPVAPYRIGTGVRVVVFVVIGTVLMAALALFDYRKLRDYWPFVYGACVALLLIVLLPGIGSSTKGTQGWIQIGSFFQLQPSELAKLGLIVGFAGLASQFRGDLDLTRVAMLLGLCGLPMGLVMLQPDLGTTLVSVGVSFALLLVAGVKPRILGLIALGAVLVTVLVLTSGLLKQYQVDRLTSYARQDQVAKTADEAEVRYNLEESKKAIGSGGVWGKGLFDGPQTRNGFVPEQSTDFIFTAVGEQFGLVGAGALILALGAIVWRVWRTAQLARDDFGMLICTGVMVMLVVQIFENVGMTMGIMPITGIPLPLVSYGGSALITTMMSLGLVQSVHMRRFS